MANLRREWISWVSLKQFLRITLYAHTDHPGTLVGSSNESSSKSGAKIVNGNATSNLLSKDEILGNAFVFILAGHETA